ncbi:MAG: thioesterase domain-containing protein [Burkholderiales bacterium]
MTALLAELRSRDVQLWADGERLRCSAPDGVLTPEMRDRLARHKGDILEFLRSVGTRARQQRAIVPLQPLGERTPIFGVGGHNGDVFCYRALAHHLGRDQPLYGLQPPGLDGQSEPLERIGQLAAYFAAQILAFRPQGPYVIAGFCAGGTIAFELGRQLLQQGAGVSFVALFGAPYPTMFRRSSLLQERLAEQRARMAAHARALMSLSFAELRSYIARKLRERRARRGAARPDAADPVLALRTTVERATIAAGRRYTPGHFAGRLCLFVPSEDWARTRNEPLRWRSSARQAEAYFGPAGCHVDDMLREPYAPAFAALFRQSRDATGTN